MIGPISQRTKRVWLLSGVVLLCAAQGLLLLPEMPDVFDTRTLGPSSLEWWCRPVEFNRFMRLPRVPAILESVFFLPNTETGWVVGDVGTIIHTRDGGRTWEPQTSPSTSNLRSVAFTDRDYGWAVGENGTIIRTKDGGKQWEVAQGLHTTENLNVVVSLDRDYEWIGGKIPYATSNGGQTWEARGTGVPEDVITRISFCDLKIGWILDGGQRYTTNDGGSGWKVADDPINAFGGSDIACEGAGDGYVAGIGGLLEITNGKATKVIDGATVVGVNGFIAFGGSIGREASMVWMHKGSGARGWIPTPQARYLRSATCPSATTCWGTSADVVLASRDGGDTWFPQAFGNLYVRVPRDTMGGKWVDVYGPPDLKLFSSDGHNWSALPVSQRRLEGYESTFDAAFHGGTYSRYPAPIYWLALLIAGLVSAQTFRPSAPERTTVRVADDSVADAPIASQSEDLLDRLPIVKQLSALIRNTATVPPFVIAINGAWGTGKSSVMHLLNADLKHAGLRPVWFNAWHQGESETLAANLLEAIREQAPAWNLAFRLRLFARRGINHWFPSMMAAAALGSIAATFYYGGDFVRDLRQDFTKFPEDTGQLLKQIRWLGLPLGLYFIWRSLSKGLEAFGVNLSQLATQTAGAFRIHKLKPKSEVLEQFRREFADVVDALADQRLVVFIDDIDRCPPDTVAEVMKAINFVTNCGPCFFVLGLARETVVPCLGLAFEKVALERAYSGGAKVLDDAQKAAARQSYAEDFLRKIVNLEINLPAIDDRHASRILDRPRPLPPRNAVRIGRALGSLLESAKPVAALLAVLLASASLTWYLHDRAIDADQQKPVQGATAPASNSAPQQLPGVVSPPAQSSSAAATSLPTRRFVPAPRDAWRYTQLSAIPSALLLVWLIGQFLRERPNRSTDDSKDYRDAVRLLSRRILEKHRTPREIKRYLNALRYAASQPQADAPPRWRRVWRKLLDQRPPPAVEGPSHTLPEPKLVVMSALRQSSQYLAEVQDDFIREKLPFPEPGDWPVFDLRCRELGISPDLLRDGAFQRPKEVGEER